MRALIQRVKESSVSVNGDIKGKIKKGMLIMLGITHSDTTESAQYLAMRCSALRIFEDEQGKMNLSSKNIMAEALVISQFTLYADTRQGNRPSFTDAAQLDQAELLYNIFIDILRNELGSEKVQTGIFRAMMDVHLVNDGPVTIMLESK
jgi:D-aminoacyl-tRNA deacylase